MSGLSRSTWDLPCVTQTLQLWLSCSTACGILVPQPGIKPVSPAMQGRLSTTGPPGRSQSVA